VDGLSERDNGRDPAGANRFGSPRRLRAEFGPPSCRLAPPPARWRRIAGLLPRINAFYTGGSLSDA